MDQETMVLSVCCNAYLIPLGVIVLIFVVGWLVKAFGPVVVINEGEEDDDANANR